MPKHNKKYFSTNQTICEVFKKRYGKRSAVDMGIVGYWLTPQVDIVKSIYDGSDLLNSNYHHIDRRPKFISYWRFMLYHTILDFFYPIPYQIEVPKPQFIPLNYI